MTAHLMTYKADRYPNDRIAEHAREVARHGYSDDNWLVTKARLKVKAGNRAWLLQQGRNRAIYGLGIVTDAPFPGRRDEHWLDGSGGKEDWFAPIRWERLAAPDGEPLISEKATASVLAPGQLAVRFSGGRITDSQDERLYALLLAASPTAAAVRSLVKDADLLIKLQKAREAIDAVIAAVTTEGENER